MFAADGDIAADGKLFAQSNILEQGHSCTALDSIGSIDGFYEINIVSIADLSHCIGLNMSQDAAKVFSPGDGQGDIIHGNTCGGIVNGQRQSAVVDGFDVGSELIVCEYAADNIAVNEGERSTVGTLDPDLDAVHATVEGTVGSSTNGCRNVHCSAYRINDNVLHRANDRLCCVAAFVGLDTGINALSCGAVDRNILNDIHTCGILLNNDTINGIAGCAGAGHVDFKIGNPGCIPHLDGSHGACMNQLAVGDAAAVIHGNAKIPCASGQSVATEIKGDSLLDLQVICAVVDVGSHANGATILSCGKGCDQFGLGGNESAAIIDGCSCGKECRLNIIGHIIQCKLLTLCQCCFADNTCNSTVSCYTASYITFLKGNVSGIWCTIGLAPLIVYSCTDKAAGNGRTIHITGSITILKGYIGCVYTFCQAPNETARYICCYIALGFAVHIGCDSIMVADKTAGDIGCSNVNVSHAPLECMRTELINAADKAADLCVFVNAAVRALFNDCA